VPFGAWKTTRLCDERNYCVQYRETNLASNILAAAGMRADSRHDRSGRDAHLRRRILGASPDLSLASRSDLDAGAPDRDTVGYVHGFCARARVTSGKSGTVNDWDWKKPY
jgi:uncharacterized protein involved in type VI secretion and phage assembly